MFVCGNIHIGHECQHSDLASPRGVCMPQDMLRTRINHYLFMRNPTTYPEHVSEQHTGCLGPGRLSYDGKQEGELRATEMARRCTEPPTNNANFK